ncbi:MAG: hypothetical protein A2486_07310 [Burkholderiales bacterium RIFOXYC12_FULL_65_23]|uniref:hypothetical protein n=1 Tax=Malikia spinosa TaxID=86180 RepID=UPI0008B958F6|nr:MAG: hypothetical protein A2486_07310 [Burkholderiales bacterium RIFOXYC12_FULL_65_23]
MSASAAWSYTSTATHWAQAGHGDWDGTKTWAAPVAFACDYKAEAKTMTDAAGKEFVARQVLYTERSAIQPGDMVLIGAHSGTDPVAAGAAEVRSVTRYADTFDLAADDYMVAT